MSGVAHPCPCCGAEMAAPLPAAALAGAVAGRVWSGIVGCLAQRPGAWFTGARIADFVYQLDANGGPVNAAVSIAVTVFRRKQELQSLGWTIETSRGYGYRLVIHPDFRGQSAGR